MRDKASAPRNDSHGGKPGEEATGNSQRQGLTLTKVLAVAAVVISLVTLWHELTKPTQEQQNEADSQNALQVNGACQGFAKFAADGTRRDRYFVEIKNGSTLALDQLKISVWYQGGDLADVDLNIGKIDFTPHTKYDMDLVGKFSSFIAVSDALPSGDKLTVHVGDVIANPRSPAQLPGLQVRVGASKALTRVVSTWSCPPQAG